MTGVQVFNSFEVAVPDVPVIGTNAERRMNRYERAERVKMIREVAWAEARKAIPVPLRPPVRITVQPWQSGRGKLGDTASGCLLTAKAAIDGVVDAHRLPDDGPDVVVEIVFLAPRRCGEGQPPGLVLLVEEVPDPG